MLDRVADGHAECEKENLCACEERRSEHDITNRPAVLEGAEDKNKLQHDVHRYADEWPEHVNDEESERLRVVESKLLLESGDGDEERYTEDNETCYAQELGGRIGSGKIL